MAQMFRQMGALEVSIWALLLTRGYTCNIKIVLSRCQDLITRFPYQFLQNDAFGGSCQALPRPTTRKAIG